MTRSFATPTALPRYLRPRTGRRDDDFAALRAQVRTILENGRHRELNAGIRRLATTVDMGGTSVRVARATAPHRMLHSGHDIHAFVADVSDAAAVVELIHHLSD
jgi:hypothetical protein